MIKLALIKLDYLECNDGDYESWLFPLFREHSDWEEISKEELEILKRYVENKNRVHNAEKLCIIYADKINTKLIISQELEKARKEELKLAKERFLREKAEKDRRDKALLKKQKLNENKEKELFEALKKKYDKSNLAQAVEIVEIVTSDWPEWKKEASKAAYEEVH